ncbi:hypothetical protein GCM10027176_43520 [Actinoallomurus bryophytorum]|uniref:Uncharacterized protein n=1 Tax=Actinoallomurus bryophytorum TaxID=1490222 RepID=A0A543CE44_9ACTN|nr:hypothetical protein [Actinoallomurus bryophytorum]TQL95372.1 hypothetical protein FB559_0875 [Actinoallomurus bryophytorum]
MKFEIVEQAGGSPSADDLVDNGNLPTEIQISADPIQGLKAGTTRLVSGVRGEAQQIADCVAEVTGLAAQATGMRLGRYAPVAAARPPVSFRAGRFGAHIERPAAGPTD